MIGRIIKWLGAKSVKDSYKMIDVLKGRGLRVGNNVIISPSARIDNNYPHLISIGNNCVIGVGVRLVAHDATFNMFNDDFVKVGKIKIMDNCVIGLNSIILPGVTIGPNVLVAAGSFVNKDIPPNSCVAGNPARFYCKFDDFISNMKEDIRNRPKFQAVNLIKKEDEKDSERRKKIMEAADEGFVYIKGIESRNPIWFENIDF